MLQIKRNRMNSTLFILVLVTGYCLGNKLVRQKRGRETIFSEALKSKCPSSEKKSNTINEALGNTKTQGTELVRDKRGWVDVVFVGVSLLVRTTSLGLTIASAVTEGCMYYPSICDNKKAIERLDNNIKKMSQIYEEEYRQSKRRFYDLKTASTNNGYIEYYINQTMQAVESIGEIEEKITLYLQINLPKLSVMAAANTSSDKYLEQSIGSLEYNLNDLKDTLKRYKRSAFLGIVIQVVIEATVNRFVKAIANAYTQVAPSKNLKFSAKLKLLPQVMKQTVKNLGTSIKKLGHGIKTLKTRNGWQALGGNIKKGLAPTMQKMKDVRTFFSPTKHKQFVQNFKLKTSERVMKAIGVLADLISIAVQVKQWHTVAQKMEKARKNYEEYHSKLQKELSVIKQENVDMNGIWLDVVNVFKTLSLTFKQLVVNATHYSNFSDVLGLSNLPVDTSNPLFTTNFNQITRETIKSQQENVMQFLRTVNYDINKIKDEMIARQVLYKNVLDMSKNEEPVADIHDDIKRVLKFNPSETVKEFGDHLSLADTVCTVSVLRYDLDEYDYFPIDAFRPRCEVNATTFELWKQKAFTKRKSRLMQEVIIRTVAKDKAESLSLLLDAIQNAYSGVADDDIRSYGSSINENDVICAVARIYTNRSMYDFIKLSDLRPDCSAVSPENIQKNLNDADKRRSVVVVVTGVHQVCRTLKVCPCLSDVADSNHVTEEDIIYALKQLDSSWKPSADAQYCGATGCSCTHI